MKIINLVCLLVLILTQIPALFLSGIAMASTEIAIHASQDAQVLAVYPTANYGTADNLILLNDPVYPAVAYIDFSTSNIPAGATIDSASLNFNLINYGDTRDASVELTVCRAAAAWSSSTLTWANQPGMYCTDPTSAKVYNIHATTGALSFSGTNMKGLVQDAIANRSNVLRLMFGFTTLSGNNCFPIFSSSEATTETLRPHLVIEYTPAATPTPSPTPSPSPSPTASPTPTPVPNIILQDSTFNSYFGDSNYDNQNELLLSDSVSFRWRDVLQFSTADVPHGLVITSAAMSIYLSSYTNSLDAQKEIEARRTTDYWTEGVVTWNNQPASSVNNPTYVSAYNTHGATGWVTWSGAGMIALVQDAMDNRSDLLSVLLRFADESGDTCLANFWSSDYSDSSKWPKLVVTTGAAPTSSPSPSPTPSPTATPAPGGTILEDSWLWQGSPDMVLNGVWDQQLTLMNASSNLSRDVLKFSVSGVPVGNHVVSATMSLNLFGYYASLDAAGQLQIKRVDSSWSEDSVTWNNQPAAFSSPPAVVVMKSHAQLGWINWTGANMVGLVQDAIDNRGGILSVVVKFTVEGSGDESVPSFSSSEADDASLWPKLVFTYSEGSPPTPTPGTTPIENGKISMVGDSITYGYPNYNGFEDALTTLLGGNWIVTNEGHNGYTAPMLQGIFTDVIATEPDYVVIMAGTNDAALDHTAVATENALQAMYTTAHNAGINVIAITIAPAGRVGTQQAMVDAVNTWIKTTATDIDYIVDIYTIMEDPAHSDYLLPAYAANDGGQVHWSLTGYSVAASRLYYNVWYISLYGCLAQTLVPDILSASSVTLNGYVVQDGGLECQGYFQWGGGGWAQSFEFIDGLWVGNITSFTLTELQPATQYWVKFCVRNVYTSHCGDTLSFTTKAEVPVGETFEIRNVTNNSATVVGHVIDAGSWTEFCRGYLGIVGYPEGDHQWLIPGDMATDGVYSYTFGNLTPAKTYSYFFWMENEHGSYWPSGTLPTFETSAGVVNAPPIAWTGLVTQAVGATSVTVTLNGYIDYDGRVDCVGGFEYKRTASPGWTWVENTTILHRGDWYAFTTTWAKGTSYDYRAVVRNYLGNGTGNLRNLITGGVMSVATPTSTPGTGISLPPWVLPLNFNLTLLEKNISGIVITVLGMVLIVAFIRSTGGMLAAAAFGIGMTFVFTIIGWYPMWIILLIGAIVGLVTFLLLLSGKK